MPSRAQSPYGLESDDCEAERVNSPSSRVRSLMMGRYRLVFFLLTTAATVSPLLGWWMVRSQMDFGPLINTSGRQRMLSQRTALCVTEIEAAVTPSERALWRERLASAVSLFERSHRALASDAEGRSAGGELGAALGEVYGPPGGLTARVRAQVERLNRFLAETEGTSRRALAREIVAEASVLLDPLDRVVGLYEAAHEKALRELMQLMLLALALTLLLLWGQFRFILRPLVDTTGAVIDSLALLKGTAGPAGGGNDFGRSEKEIRYAETDGAGAGKVHELHASRAAQARARGRRAHAPLGPETGSR